MDHISVRILVLEKDAMFVELMKLLTQTGVTIFQHKSINWFRFPATTPSSPHHYSIPNTPSYLLSLKYDKCS